MLWTNISKLERLIKVEKKLGMSSGKLRLSLAISSVLNFELVDKKNFITEHKRLTGKINLFDLPTNYLTTKNISASADGGPNSRVCAR